MISIKDALLFIFKPTEPGHCVVCYGLTSSRIAMYGRGLVYCHHQSDIESFGCREVVDYWEEDDPPRTFRTYQDYIKSNTWKIKATSAKRMASWRCESCQETGNASTLHAHHNTYDRLYKEQRRDIDILCAICHREEHGL